MPLLSNLAKIKKINFFIKNIPKNNNILEIGSGDGWLSREHMTRAGGRKIASLKPLDMVLIPQYLALRARQDGWYVRSIIIWSKINPMPESVNGWRWERHKIKIGNRGRAREAYSGHIGYQDHGDNGGFLQDAIWEDCPGCPKCNPNDGYILRKGSWRPTDSFEYILMLTKSNSYFCDKEAVTELSTDPESHTGRRHRSYSRPDYEASAQGREPICNDSGEVGKIYPRRNMRSVWTFPAGSYSGAHFATYPPRLPELCIRASTSEAGCCLSCGAPYDDDASRLSVGKLAHTVIRQGAQSSIKLMHSSKTRSVTIT